MSINDNEDFEILQGKQLSEAFLRNLNIASDKEQVRDKAEGSWKWVECATLNEHGDRYQPLGRGGHASAVILFKDEKIRRREHFLIVFGGASRSGEHFGDCLSLNLGWFFF